MMSVADQTGTNPAMPLPQSGHGIHCGQLILRKISKIGATRRQILRLKCTKFDFRWGSAPQSLQRSPRLPPVNKGLLRGGRGKGRGREGEGKEGESRGGEERGGLAPNWGVWIRQWMM